MITKKDGGTPLTVTHSDSELVTAENGTQYFVCGKNRVKVSEHFKDGGHPLDDLIIDAVRHIAGRAESA